MEVETNELDIDAVGQAFEAIYKWIRGVVDQHLLPDYNFPVLKITRSKQQFSLPELRWQWVYQQRKAIVPAMIALLKEETNEISFSVDIKFPFCNVTDLIHINPDSSAERSIQTTELANMNSIIAYGTGKLEEEIKNKIAESDITFQDDEYQVIVRNVNITTVIIENEYGDFRYCLLVKLEGSIINIHELLPAVGKKYRKAEMRAQGFKMKRY